MHLLPENPSPMTRHLIAQQQAAAAEMRIRDIQAAYLRGELTERDMEDAEQAVILTKQVAEAEMRRLEGRPSRIRKASRWLTDTLFAGEQ